MLTGDTDLDRALSRSTSRHCEPLPEDRSTFAEFSVIVDNACVAKAWRPDAALSLYLLCADGRGGTH